MARKELLKAFLDGFEDRLQCIAGEDILSAWKRHAGALNRRVVVKTTRGDFSGRAVDVDTNGALVLEEDDGSRRRVYYGDCFYQSASPPGNQE